MSENPGRTEATLAYERNQDLQHSLAQKRLASALLTVALSIAGLASLVFGFAMAGFCLMIAAALLLVRFLDASGHLHEVRSRSTKTLVPDFSLLKRHEPVSSSDPRQSLPHA